MKYVSPDQYDVFVEMNAEGKLDAVGNPKPEHLVEFFNRLAAKRKSKSETKSDTDSSVRTDE